jgi:hypothetical protein
MKPEYLTLPDRRLAYQSLIGDAEKPRIIFLGGYASDMTGTKASFLAECCAASNVSYVRFDYRGNGQSSDDFANCTLGDWLDDSLAMINAVAMDQPLIVVGSSMGGWLGLLLALRLEPIKAFIGVAAAPDFTEDLIVPNLTPEQRHELETTGFIKDTSSSPDHPMIITKKFLDESRRHLILRQTLNINCPIRLLQGKQDAEVPWRTAQRIADNTPNCHMQIRYIPDGDHRLSRLQDLELLWETISGFVVR